MRKLVGAAALTIVFFVVAALFVEIGSCGPTNDASAAFFIIMLPAVMVVSRFGDAYPLLGWAVMVAWVFILSWLAVTLGTTIQKQIKHR